MTLIGRNVDLGSPLGLSSWRKVAIGTWRSAGDPSVYGILELDAGPAIAYMEKVARESGRRITLSHFAGKAVAETLRRHPEINCIQRWGRLYPRKTVDVFFQVATDPEGKDLSGTTVRNADRKTMAEIAAEMEERVRKIKSLQDDSYTRMKGLFGVIPGFLAALMIRISGFILYGLNLWSPLLGVPKDPFGSVMITNIGSLGLDTAFAPLVPYSRVPILVALGSALPRPIIRDGEITKAMTVKLCVTFDHRLIDGVHASKMSATVRRIFAEPDRELHAGR